MSAQAVQCPGCGYMVAVPENVAQDPHPFQGLTDAPCEVCGLKFGSEHDAAQDTIRRGNGGSEIES